jgi:hypothetical protein
MELQKILYLISQAHHGPRIATPSSTGCSTDVVQRQPLASDF